MSYGDWNPWQKKSRASGGRKMIELQKPHIEDAAIGFLCSDDELNVDQWYVGLLCSSYVG